MAMKPFEIQEATLVMGGVALEAGNTGVVIPGVTQATNYRVEEVKDTDFDQTRIFESAPTVIDSETYGDYLVNGTSTVRATYSVELEDNGYIDDIEVTNNGGSYVDNTPGDNDLYAYIGVELDPFATFVSGDWVEIPFRPKMRVGEVENIGGGGNANTGDITFEDNMIIGAGEDSGDGNGYNTIRLVPDLSLGENGQYIVIDPTAPNHIHIRAGGEQDNSNAILFLGGEKNHVSIEDNNGVTISNEQTFDSYNYYHAGSDFTDFTWFEENGNYFVQFTTVTAPMVSDFWNFTNGTPNALSVYDSQGTHTLTYGGSGSNTVANVYKLQVVETPIVDFVATALEFQIFTTNSNEMYLRNNDFRVDVKDDVRILSSDIFRLVNRSTESPIEITTNDNETSNTWSFGADGNMFLPRNSFNNDVAYLKSPNGDTNVKLSLNGGNGVEIIADVYGNATTAWQFGTDGVLTLPNSSVIRPDQNSSLQVRAFTETVNPTAGDLLSAGIGIYPTQIAISYVEQGSAFDEVRHQWDFHAVSGELQLASGGVRYSDDTIQTTAWSGGRVVTVPAHSTGADGDLQGDLAFNSIHIYYCIADYNQLGHQVTGSDYLGRTSLNTNSFQLTKTADTLQITVGDIISDSDGGATSMVNGVTSDENYTYVNTGGLAYSATFPLTFTSTDYVAGGNIWKRVAWSNDTW